MTSPILNLSEMNNAQSQPHVVVNAMLRALEVFAQITAIDITNALPGSPSDGDCYILDTAPSEGSAHQVAYYSGGWKYLTPREGWKAYVQDENRDYLFVGGVWVAGASASGIDAVNISFDGATSPGSPTPKNVLEALNEIYVLLSSANALLSSLCTTGIPYSQPGKPGAGAVYHVLIPFACTIPASLTGTYGYAGTTATGSSAFSLSKNGGAAFGTVTFGAGSNTPTLAAASLTSFAAGDRLTITAPGSQDATLENVGFTLAAVRS